MCKENQLIYLILSKKLEEQINNKKKIKKKDNVAQQNLINIILNATLRFLDIIWI